MQTLDPPAGEAGSRFHGNDMSAGFVIQSKLIKKKRRPIGVALFSTQNPIFCGDKEFY